MFTTAGIVTVPPNVPTWSVLDETPPDDADYIQAASANQLVIYRMAPPSPPIGIAPFIVQYVLRARAKSLGSGVLVESILLDLIDPDTGFPITNNFIKFVSRTAFTTYEFPVTAEEAALITKPDDLWLSMTTRCQLGESVLVSWCDVRVDWSTRLGRPWYYFLHRRRR